MEGRRIIWNRKSLSFFFILMLVESIWFYGWYADEYEPLTKSDIVVTDYGEKYLQMMATDNELSQIKIFNSTTQTKERDKTLQDFKKLSSLQVKTEKREGISTWISFSYSGYFILFFLIYLIFVSMESENKGLAPLIYATGSGRLMPALIQLRIWIVTITLGTFISNSILLLISYSKSGNIHSLLSPIQSIYGFEDCTLPICAGTFVIIISLWQIFALLILVLFIWLLFLMIHNTKIALTLCGTILVVEYFLSNWILDQSRWAIFKVINLFSFLNAGAYFQDYSLITLGDITLERMQWMGIALICIVLLLTCACIVAKVRRKPFYQESFFERLLHAIARKIRHLISRLPWYMYEWYKMLFSQRGLIVLLFFLLVLTKQIWSADASGGLVLGSTAEYLNDFYEKYAGPITDDTRDHIEKLEKQVEWMIESENPAAEYYRSGLNEVKKRLQYIESSDHSALWLVNDRGYRYLLGDRSEDTSFTYGTLILLCLLIMVSGLFPYERRSDTVPLIRSMSRGRGALHRKKLYVAMSLATVLATVMMVMEWYDASIHATLSSFGAPVQSLPFLSEFSLHISIGAYLVVCMIYRLVILYGITYVYVGMSEWSKTQEIAILCGGIFMVTSILLLIGEETCGKFSLTKLLHASHFLRQGNAGIAKLTMAVFALYGVGFILHLSHEKQSGDMSS